MKKTALAAALALGVPLSFAQQSMTPSDYWAMHARNGYLTPEAALMYPAPDGRSASDLDADRDGRVSRAEWAQHHGTKAAGADVPSAVTDDPRNPTDAERRRSQSGLGNTGR